MFNHNNKNNGRRLRLVVDNAPGYKLKPVPQLVIEQKRNEYKKKIERIEKISQEQLDILKRNYRKIGALAALVIAGAAGAYVFSYNWNDAPTEIVPLGRDLNNDNMSDAYILQRGGHKIPMYGVRLSNGIIIYKTADYMKQRQNNIVDYKNIEDKLNE